MPIMKRKVFKPHAFENNMGLWSSGMTSPLQGEGRWFDPSQAHSTNLKEVWYYDG